MSGITKSAKTNNNQMSTWKKAVQYYCTYFHELKSVIEDFEEESQFVKAVKKLF